jgi:hypothetical protein
MNEATRDLTALIGAELGRPIPAGANALAAAVRARHGNAVRAVLFYGSCLRRGEDREGVLDLYALVDGYRGAYESAPLAAINALLPPNVFYVETRHAGRTVRAKYAVLSLADLAHTTSTATFEPYFWARFAQPCALAYSAGPEVTGEVAAALTDAVLTFVRAGLALAPEAFDARELWEAMLSETYRCEVRAERAGAGADLVRFAPERYAEVTRLALAALQTPATARGQGVDTRWSLALPDRGRQLARLQWTLRRGVGKTLFLLRILRNALIFEGGVDYVIWKVERHSGTRVDPSWRESRFRLLALGAEVVRQYRRGAFL